MSGGPTPAGMPPGAYAGALACLPGMGPATLHHLLEGSAPADVWDAVRGGEVVRPPFGDGRGRAAPVRASWADVAARLPVEGLWEQWVRQGIGITWPGDGRYPARLRQDPEPPGVLFWRGHLGHLDRRCVAIVGTRRCSPDGRSTAYELGRDLAAAGVCVVSGLALGIDGAAHLGALDVQTTSSGTPGGTVGVAASGVDVVYPPRHSALWARVAEVGAVISENPPGRPAQAWRFPSRNRVIAGLADLVVVVESHAAGGSLITADKAMDRGIEVRVVPGPVHSRAAAGSNQLLYDGPGPVRDATDVLDTLGEVQDRPAARPRRRAVPRSDRLTLAPRGADLPPPQGPGDGSVPASESAEGVPPVPESLSPPQAKVLEAVGWRPTSLTRVVERSGLAVGVVGRALDELSDAGMVTEEGGWWCRRAGSEPPRLPAAP